MVAVLSAGGSASAADSACLYGIHFWGLAGSPVDNAPCVLLDCGQIGGWDTEVVLTHGEVFAQAPYFVPYYQDLYNNKHITIITRIDYTWGQTVPSPTNPHYANWTSNVVGAVNTLRNFAHIWVIGNEPNLTGEGNGWPGNQVTPSGYATIYRNVRNAIHSSAQVGPPGQHIVLIAPPSPGGVVPGIRWMSDTNWVGQVIDNIPANEIDGFAIHSYGGTVTDFHNGYVTQ
jgi:hypothetical protein